MEKLFSAEEIGALSAEIDNRLTELQSGELSFESNGGNRQKKYSGREISDRCLRCH